MDLEQDCFEYYKIEEILQKDRKLRIKHVLLDSFSKTCVGIVFDWKIANVLARSITCYKRECDHK